MKINDVITEGSEDVTEAPAGMLSRAASAIGAKLRPTTAGRAQSAGKLQTKQVADALWKRFQQYLGQIGGNPNVVKASDIKKYLMSDKSIGYSQATVDKALNTVGGTGATLNPASVQKAFMAIAQQSMLAGTKPAPKADYEAMLKSLAGLTPAQKADLIKRLGGTP